jgi:hypothetical protein
MQTKNMDAMKCFHLVSTLTETTIGTSPLEYESFYADRSYIFLKQCLKRSLYVNSYRYKVNSYVVGDEVYYIIYIMKILSSGIYRLVVRRISACASKEQVTASYVCYLLLVLIFSLLDLFFDPEDRGDMFPRNIG